jgi:hypothetical protein
LQFADGKLCQENKHPMDQSPNRFKRDLNAQTDVRKLPWRNGNVRISAIGEGRW